jgi:hypothetical protein
LDAIWSGVDDLRREWVDHPQLRFDDFKVAVLSGAWTLLHRGVGADAIQGASRGAEPKRWCSKSKVPASARFEISTYSAANAGIMARTWCSKMQTFFNLCLSTGKDVTDLSPEDRSSWQEPSEFTALATQMSDSKLAMKRVQQLRALFAAA